MRKIAGGTGLVHLIGVLALPYLFIFYYQVIKMVYLSTSISVGTLITVICICIKIINGFKCLLRKTMLDTFYKCKETKTIQEYEFENFLYCYEAYKSMKGNSFIERVYEEIRTYEVIR